MGEKCSDTHHHFFLSLPQMLEIYSALQTFLNVQHFRVENYWFISVTRQNNPCLGSKAALRDLKLPPFLVKKEASVGQVFAF